MDDPVRELDELASDQERMELLQEAMPLQCPCDCDVWFIHATTYVAHLRDVSLDRHPSAQ